MKRALVLTAVLALAAAAAPSASSSLARYGRANADKETLEIVGLDGQLRLWAVGALIGRVERGRIVIVDRPVGPETDVTVTGDYVSREISDAITVYRGTGMRFRIFAGGWTLRVEGEEVYAGAVVRGYLTLKGLEGRFSIGGDPPERVPEEWQTFRLGD